jgi:hypothetical protein
VKELETKLQYFKDHATIEVTLIPSTHYQRSLKWRD